jgi:hypothetical protein
LSVETLIAKIDRLIEIVRTSTPLTAGSIIRNYIADKAINKDKLSDDVKEQIETKPDYNQNDETANDYIKNRPFSADITEYTFPNADYENPSISASTDDDQIDLYKISDTPIVLNYGDTVTFGNTVDGVYKTTSFKLTEDNLQFVYERDEKGNDTDKLQAYFVNADNDYHCQYFIIFTKFEQEPIVFPKGIYVYADTKENLKRLEKIKTIKNLVRLDDIYTPDLVINRCNEIEAKFDDYTPSKTMRQNYYSKYEANDTFYKKSEIDNNFLNTYGINPQQLCGLILSNMKDFSYMYSGYKSNNTLFFPKANMTKQAECLDCMFYDVNVPKIGSYLYLDNAICIDSLVSFSKIKEISITNMSAKCVHIGSAFTDNTLLEVINGDLDFSGLATVTGMNKCPCCGASLYERLSIIFYNTPIKEIRFKKESIPAIYGSSLSFNKAVNLSDDSINSIIDGLVTYNTENPAPKGAYQTTISLPSNVVDKLTDEQLTKINNKGWKVG